MCKIVTNASQAREQTKEGTRSFTKMLPYSSNVYMYMMMD